MNLLKPATVCIVLVSAILGCSVRMKTNEKSETDMGSHHVVVKPGRTFTSSSSSSGGGNTTYEYSCGDVSITIRNEELIVNNVTYGQLNAGDPVSVDNRKVFVAGQPREGKPLSEEEILKNADVKETTKELAGYAVTIRPGAHGFTTTQLFGKHTLTVGKTKVTIKNDELSVNDKAYGKLKKGDAIVVENSRVFVSGTERQPAK